MLQIQMNIRIYLYMYITTIQILYEQIQTSYLSFVLHGQDLLVIFGSTQKRVNRDKMDFASKQRKSRQDSIHCKFVMWSNHQKLHITDME